ncbi:hypothetical protein [Cryobacterium sp. M15]|uniref:hypothetical protein n=1 Tax=Cryobacterium sp. M15 TaxID=2048291 RepID=UPI000CE41CE4|nr:hypothetical protein [Cryobacterium sp. M15]
MNARRDDDALNWAGDDDPTLQEGSTDRARPASGGVPEGWSIPRVSADSEVATDTTTEADNPEPSGAQPPDNTQPSASAPSSVALIGMGILAGMYLLYTIGWFIGVARIENSITDPVTEFMFSLGAWLAVAAPLAWFGVTYWLTMSRPRARLIWLLIGVVVLAPVPFIIGSGAGS